MSKLKQALEAGRFAVTAELAPPKGTDWKNTLEKAEILAPVVDAINVTDFQSACVKGTSLGLCIELLQMGIEPVLQMTGRDRNRIAVQGELITAGHFGVHNMLALTGDHPTVGDNKEAKPVYELDAVGLIETAQALTDGHDLGGSELAGAPEFFVGAAVSPAFKPEMLQVMRMKQKINAGAEFFQTQAVFDTQVMKSFRENTQDLNTFVLAGIIPLKSAGMARFMNKNVPGIDVPQTLIDRLDAEAKNGGDPAALGVEMAAELIKELKEQKLCDGVHIMAIGGEKNIPVILEKAGLVPKNGSFR